MITPKQRAYLKGLAHNLKPLAQLGKEGISDAFIQEMENLLNNHELIKVSVFESNLLDTKAACQEVAEKTNAEFVQAIGRKFTVYRQAREKEKIKIELPRK